MDKLYPLESLPAMLDAAPWSHGSAKLVYCHGCFDILHVGHIRHLQAAKQLGCYLVVTVTPDRFVGKGPGRPAFPETERAEALAALGCVDFVAINTHQTAVEAIKLIRPDLYVKGPEYRHQMTEALAAEQAAVVAARGRLVFTDGIKHSSTTLLNPEPVRWLNKFKGVKAMVLGEAIIDKYNFCQALGKAGKEPILAVQFNSTKSFHGGAVAIAEHLKSFDAAAYPYTGPPITKERFLEEYPLQKLFEVYHMANQHDCCLSDRAGVLMDRYDAVIMADYGHGLIDDDLIETVTTKAKFLAVNTQSNAGNHGFNTLARYRRADFVCISERELRLDYRDNKAELAVLMERVGRRLNCQAVLVTRGQHGLCCWTKDGITTAQALIDHHKDRVGAGDAVFAVTAICTMLGAPPDIICAIGNAVGAAAVNTIGVEPVDKHTVVRLLSCK